MVVFDVLFRVLRAAYPAARVTCVRNITDIDDKINQRARESGEAIGDITAAPPPFSKLIWPPLAPCRRRLSLGRPPMWHK